jgi:D-alanine-D-alanine ligase
MNKLRIGYTCNVRDTSKDADERYNEWEPPETVEAVTTALADAGCEVSVIDVGPDIFHVLERRRSELDLVFNNAEGLEEGELREAIVPFFCEQLGIPHTGSSPKTFINTMDKATAKRLVAYDGVATPRFQLMRSRSDPLLPGLAFPLMVKPDSEGTSIGITQASKVDDDRGLRAQVERILDTYRQPALVEEFIGGTEYTIGVVGSYVLPILAAERARPSSGPPRPASGGLLQRRGDPLVRSRWPESGLARRPSEAPGVPDPRRGRRRSVPHVQRRYGAECLHPAAAISAARMAPRRRHRRTRTAGCLRRG